MSNTTAALEIPVPPIDAQQLLVKVSHVAQNPTGVQSFDKNVFGDGSVFGCDFVGEGDRIAGLIWGGEIKGVGAYSKHVVADQRITASTIPLASATAWLALFPKKCLNIDRTSVGLFTLQIAALYNFKVVSTCSPRNFEFLGKSGATHVFDHSDPGVITNITYVAPDLEYIFDTRRVVLCTVRPGKANMQNVTKRTNVTDVPVWTAFFKEHRYGDFVWPLESGTIKPNPVVVKRGLGVIEEGFQDYRDGKISAYKIIYEV
ncbi:hypothetical protein DM02DRAFT_639921 [Periconia macrospinosa]|uniref:Enoyl reductase (ER) domain-containing protein n=1 Tax=Periconia macrospinosa TaxID=97972 RepID=A0A2V1E1G4_9PLEO|nr:hypothetical protein DM02DRAFT_639921 [Periconia macrospinosa]